MERSECESLGTRSIELMRNMRFAPYLVATIYSKRPPYLNFAVYIASIRSYMLPRRLRRLDALLVWHIACIEVVQAHCSVRPNLIAE